MAYPNNNNGNYNRQWKGTPFKQQGTFGPQQQDTKKSGATYSKIRKGKSEGGTAVNAWRKTKAGLMTAKGFPVDSKIHKSDKGNEFVRYAVEIAINGTTQTYWTLMNLKTQKISISELSLVISPNGSGFTASGKKVTGFFGANYKRR